MKFVVQYSYTYRPRNTLFVLSAYQNGPDVYVLYRIQGATDGLGKIVPPQQVILRDDDDPYRISEMEWEGFLALRDGESFLRNSRRWTKLAPETVAPIVAGKVFRRLLPDQK